MDQDGERRQRIKIWMGAAMIIVALIVDISELGLEWLGIGLVANIVTTPAFTFIFWLWFMILGIPFVSNPKRFFVFLVECLAELIPGLDAVGGFFWTAGTIILVIMVRSEDKNGIIGQISGATMNLVQQRYRPYRKLGSGQFTKKMSQMKEDRRATGISPLAISKKEIATKAAGERNPEFNEKQYERATGLATNTANKAIESKLGPQTRRQFLGAKRQRGAEADKNALSGNTEQSSTSPNTLNLKGSQPE